MDATLDAAYWRRRYREQETGWDMGEANAGLVAAFTTHVSPTASVLIPGAGRGYEAEALWRRGYERVYVCDWAEEAFVRLRESPYLPSADRLIVGDFFQLDGVYDAILEQTFFCAISPDQRGAYVAQCHRLLKPGGTWVGVLFDRKFAGGPPYGGSRAAYQTLFSTLFDVRVLHTFDASAAPRAGSELLGVFKAKDVT